MTPRTPRHSERRPLPRPRGGFGLVEVMVSLAVMTIAILAMLWTSSSGARLREQTSEYTRASFAVARVHERLRAGALDDVYAALRADPVFQDGELTMEVRFPEAVVLDFLIASEFDGWDTGADALPKEEDVPSGWRYRDLDDDGEVELDPAATATSSLLPVQVTARWAGGETQTRFMVTER